MLGTDTFPCSVYSNDEEEEEGWEEEDSNEEEEEEGWEEEDSNEEEEE